MRMRLWWVAVLALGAGSPAWAGDDWQMWNTYSFKLPVIKKKVDLNGSFETRFRDDMDEFFRYHFYVGPDYYPVKWLTLGFQYGNVQQKPVGGDFQTEHRFMYFVTPKFTLADLGLKDSPLGDLKFNLQNRLEWRHRYYNNLKNTWRYRFYPKISYPVFKREKLEISPFVGDAFYFPLENSIAFNENRIYSGLTFKLFKQIGLDFYYMRQATRSGRGGDWTGNNVLGTAVAYEF